jgi:Ca2+-binding RTX toxin-like protein
MIGSRGANRFDGGDGDDRLRGGRGNDVLAGGVGSAGGIDRFSGGPGSDRIESEDDEFNQDPETINCGTGNDRVDSSDPGDRAADDCERALLKDGSGGTAGTVSIHPRVEGGTATFHLVCTRPAGARCVGAVRVNEAQTDYDVAPGEADVAVTLSAADAAQLAADGRLDARLAAAGEFYATWTATLR